MIFLGIDCGTQSTKTVALDFETGAILQTAQKAYSFVPGLPEGAMEQNASDWIAAANATIAEVLDRLGERKKEVRGIGVSGQQHGLVVLDADDQVVRPAKLWCDTSTTRQCEEITAHFGSVADVIALVGNAMLPGYTAPKIRWLQQSEPDNWKRTRSVLLPHDYLNFWLTGVKCMEYGDASGTALLDVRSREWSAPIVDFLGAGLRERLPGLRSSLKPVELVRGELCKRWDLKTQPLVSAGGGDNMMGAIGTGNTRPGVVTASLGTSGTLYAFSTSPVVDSKGEVAAFCDSTDNWLPLVCTMNVTLVTELVRQLAAWDYADFDAAVEETSAGSDGLLLLPYLAGERTPNLPNGRGVLYGLTTRNFTRAHLARAAMEGATLGLGYGMERFRELGLHPEEIRLTGGGSNSRIWRQIAADVFGVPTVCLQMGEGASLGAAIQAGWTWARANGSEATLPEVTDRLVQTNAATRAEPIQANVALYRGLLEKSIGLRDALTSVKML